MRSKLLRIPDVSKIEMLGAQDERIFVEFSMQQLAGLGIDRSALIAALQAQNVVQPAGVIQTGNEQLLLRVTGAFESEEDLRNIEMLRFDPGAVVVAHGLETGDLVVTAGVQVLHPGQSVRLVGPAAS